MFKGDTSYVPVCWAKKLYYWEQDFLSVSVIEWVQTKFKTEVSVIIFLSILTIKRKQIGMIKYYNIQ